MEDTVNPVKRTSTACYKGKKTERDLAKLLNKRFGGGFSRTIGSGNRWAQTAYLPKHAQETFCGDIVCPENFAFMFECKGGYDQIDLNSLLFNTGYVLIEKFLRQVEDEVSRSDRKPILAWKRSNKPWLAMLRTEDLPNTNFEYRFIYKLWSIVSLDVLLEADNVYFYKDSPNTPNPA